MASLRFERGPRSGEAVAIDKRKFTFGRQPGCDCVLAHSTVSREHFYIELNGGKYFLVDENSGNGTFVNGEHVSWIEIKNGDRIQAGPFVLMVELSGPEQTRAHQTEIIEGNATQRAGEETGTPGFDETHAEAYPREYLEGIGRFNIGSYFDAHEIWEDIWLRSTGEEKLFYQTLIQAAVGMHHYERGNVRGALGMYKNVMEKLERLPGVFMSLDLVEFRRRFEDYFSDIVDQEGAQPSEKQGFLIDLLKLEASR